MRTRTRIATLLVAGACAVSTMAAADPEEPVLTDRGLQVVGTDSDSDWGQGAAPEAQPAAEQMGQELTQAAIGFDPDDPGTLLFEISVASLPPMGGMPEATRYTWNFQINKDKLELDGKFTNYSRGACDPTAGSCPPPRDPGLYPFALRGNCAAGEGNITLCEELALLHAVFDTSTNTITIAVPVDLIGVQECDKISGGGNIFGGSISAAPSAFFTSSAMPLDTMIVDGKFEIPMADGTDCPVIE